MILVFLCATLTSNSAIAGGAASGGASEWTQVLNYLKNIESVAQEVITAQQLVLQTEYLVKSLQDNPLAVVMPSFDTIISNQEKINKLSKDIDGNWQNVGGNALKNLKNPRRYDMGTHGRQDPCAKVDPALAVFRQEEINVYDNVSKKIQMWRQTLADDAKRQSQLNIEAAKAAVLGSAKSQVDSTNHIQATALEKLGELKILLTDLNATFTENKIRDESKKQSNEDGNANVSGCGPKGIGATKW